MSQGPNLWGDEEEEFLDIPDEVNIDRNGIQQQSAPVNVKTVRPQPKPTPPAPVEEEYEEYESEESDALDDVLESVGGEEDFSEVFNDANLRIEQGRLYQLVMNHSLFSGVDADSRAVANVEREIKKFARESMEVMLGMRQTTPVHAEPMVSSPFNDLEVEILKKLASKATNGATETAEANQVAEKIKQAPTGLNTIGAPKKVQRPSLTQQAPKKPLAKKPATPVKRTKLQATIEQIAREEGVPVELIMEEGLLGKSPYELTEQELIERNKLISRRRGAKVETQAKIPMASYEQTEMLATQMAGKAMAAPGMSRLLEAAKNMPIKKS